MYILYNINCKWAGGHMRYCIRGPELVGSALLVSDSPGLLEWYQSMVWCSAGMIQLSCPHSISLRC